MTLSEPQKHAQAESGRLTPIASLSHPRRAAVHPAAGIGVPNPTAHKAPPIEARRFFLARVSSGRCTSYLFMVGGAGAARPPVRRPVRQPAPSATLRMASQWRIPEPTESTP